MTEPVPIPPPGFDALTAEAKLEYVQSLWERLSLDPERVPVPEWHREIVRERVEAYRCNPDQGKPWHEVREELRRLLEDHRQ